MKCNGTEIKHIHAYKQSVLIYIEQCIVIWYFQLFIAWRQCNKLPVVIKMMKCKMVICSCMTELGKPAYKAGLISCCAEEPNGEPVRR